MDSRHISACVFVRTTRLMLLKRRSSYVNRRKKFWIKYMGDILVCGLKEDEYGSRGVGAGAWKEQVVM